MLENGNIISSVRASMAIPSVFTAVNINNQKLVDGGLIRNFPASDLKAMGAGECPPPVDWEQANTEITGMLDQVYSSGFRGDVYVHDQKRAFQIRLPRGVKVADVHKPLCDIIGRNGLKDLAALEVKSVDTTEDYAKLAC